MTDLIIRPKAKPTCGQCEFANPMAHDLNMIQCNGIPPIPCIVGGQQTIRGAEYQIELLSPQLPRARRGCALWREKTPEFGEQQ